MALRKDEIEGTIHLYDPYEEGALEATGGVVRMLLEPTGWLEREADKARMAEGHMPLFTYEAEYDCQGWYDFWAECRRDGLASLYADPQHTMEPSYGYHEIKVDPYVRELVYSEIVREVGRAEWERLFNNETESE